MGTVVSAGSGVGVVVRTGADTEFGAIAARLGERQPQTAFQRACASFSRMLVCVTAILAVTILVVNLAARPLRDRVDPVRPVDRRRPDAAAAAGDRHGEPLDRRPPAGAAQGRGEAAGGDRGSRQHRGVLHGQDRHAHRGADHVLGGAGPRWARARTRCCATGCCATRRVVTDGRSSAATTLDRALWQAPAAQRGSAAGQAPGHAPFDYERRLVVGAGAGRRTAAGG